MSVADAVNVKTAPAALVASTVAFAGTVTAGAVVSRTVTVKVFVPVFPCVSVAPQVTVVVPAGDVVPAAGMHVTGPGPSGVSPADALKGNGAPRARAPSTDAFGGR